jgi:ADP-dependent NAD(P)H-hydrate dehydratase
MTHRSLSPLPILLPRKPDSHKGDYGRILLIGGSRGMAGAISLSGKAALRSGAGLATLAVPTTILETVAGFDPCYMTWPLPADDLGRIAADADFAIDLPLRNANVVALGPGLGRSDTLRHLVHKWYAEISAPMVVDADALNLLSQVEGSFATHAGPRVLTPHPGEFRTMTGMEKAASREALEAKAIECAGQWGVTIILKGHHSFITDGAGAYHNSTGNPGMATGGVGDVLTGVTASLLSQFAAPLDAARLGVHVHGLAGDLAAQELGQVGMTALDVCNALPRAFEGLG